MKDILYSAQGLDLGVFDTQTAKAGNILSVQLGSLEYLPNFGIDLAYFMQSDFKFQNASFKAYLIEVLANNAINVASIVQQIEDLFVDYSFNITDNPTTTSLVTG